MASRHTPNYKLSQWERTDKVVMEDFNGDNAKIDAAIRAVEEKADSKAGAAALSALQSTVNSLKSTVSGKQDSSSAVRLAAGSYVGTGDVEEYGTAYTQTISLTFKPKAVLVVEQDSMFYNSNGSGHICGALAVTGSPGIYKNHTTLEVTSRGFTAHTYYESNSIYIRLNDKGKIYHYIAVG